MGGPGGGGGGYATTGSIGATAGSGGDAVDECGLRFLLAMRHHTCLMRSLPPKHRAVLEERVKFIVYLTVQLAYGTCLSLAETFSEWMITSQIREKRHLLTFSSLVQSPHPFCKYSRFLRTHSLGLLMLCRRLPFIFRQSTLLFHLCRHSPLSCRQQSLSSYLISLFLSSLFHQTNFNFKTLLCYPRGGREILKFPREWAWGQG